MKLIQNFTILVALLIPFFLFSQEENITFPSAGVDLRGTLAIPTGDGPFPVVILVHGSGANDRNQTTPIAGGNATCLFPQLVGTTIRTLKDISDYLSANGIAVLRYDKRSFSHPASIHPITGSPYDFIKDLENAIAFVKARTAIDSDCIVLAGHSQGSALIAGVKNGKEDVAGLISLAGAVSPIDSVITEQFRRLFTDCAGSPFCGNTIAAESYSVFKDLRASNDVNEQFTLNVPSCNFNFPLGYPTFWQDWIDLGGNNVLNNYNSFEVPKLIIQGKEDFNVPFEEAIFFRAGLDPSRTQVNIFDGINHYLTPQDDPKVSTEILQTIVGWIKNIKGNSSVDKISKEDFGLKIFQNGASLIIEFSDQVVNSKIKFDEIRITNLSGQVLIKKDFSKISFSNQKRIEISDTGNAFSGIPKILTTSFFSKNSLIFSENILVR